MLGTGMSLRTATSVRDALAVQGYTDVSYALAEKCQRCAGGSQVVVVTTPQNVAVADVLRCIEMLQVTGAPVLGVVENMSYLQCPDCGRRLEVFGRGGGQWLAEQFDVPLLGQIPLDPAICEGGDLGEPASGSDSPVAQAFRELAGMVAAQVSIRQFAGAN